MEVIAIVVEHIAGRIADITRDQMECARQAAGFINATLHGIIIGNDIQGPAELLASTWGIQTTGVLVRGVQYYQCDVWLDALETVLRRMPVTGIILGHTPNGMELGPALAVRLGASCVAGVSFIDYESEQIAFHRPLFGGKISARVKPEAHRWVISVQPGAFPSSQREGATNAAIQLTEVQLRPSKMRFMGLHSVAGGDTALQQAKAVVAGGRGLGRKENLKLLGELAGAIPGSVVGGSRPLCDAGWLDYTRQIGLTGNTVRPNLYIACGISGAFQHVVGMRESDLVVAINNDPHAAIFNHADVAIVADLVDFLPILTDKLKQVHREKEAHGSHSHVDHGS